MLEPEYKRFFDTLANRTRLEIIFELRKGTKNVSELTEKLGYHQSTVSNNLQVLLDCEFVYRKNNGRKREYTLNDETIEPLLQLVDEHTERCCKKLVEAEK